MIGGYNRFLSSLPGVPCGGVPAVSEPPCFRRFRRTESRGREGRAACATRRAGSRGHFSRPYRGPFLCGEPSSLPRSILDQSSCVLPVSGRVPARECSGVALSRWLPLHHAAFPTLVVKGALHCPVCHSTRGLIILPAEGLSFPFPPEGTMAENAFRKPCEIIARIVCLRPVPLLSGVPIP